MKRLFVLLVIVWMAMPAVAQSWCHYQEERPFMVGAAFAVHENSLTWAVTNSYTLGVGAFGVDVIYPPSKEENENLAVFLRAGLRFPVRYISIGPDIVASYEKGYKFGFGIEGEYPLMGPMGFYFKGFLTHSLHPQENGIKWDNATVTVLAGLFVSLWFVSLWPVCSKWKGAEHIARLSFLIRDFLKIQSYH